MTKFRLFFICFECFDKEHPGRVPGLTSKDPVRCEWCGKIGIGVSYDNAKEIVKEIEGSV